VLDAMRRGAATDRATGAAHRAQLVVRDAISRLCALSVIMSVAGLLLRTPAERRSEGAHPSDQWQTFLKNGVVLGFSSDWPCSWPPNPFVSIQSAITRDLAFRRYGRHPICRGRAALRRASTGKFYTPNSASASGGVDAYTQGSAYASLPTPSGTLERKVADLAVLSQTSLRCRRRPLGNDRGLDDGGGASCTGATVMPPCFGDGLAPSRARHSGGRPSEPRIGIIAVARTNPCGAP